MPEQSSVLLEAPITEPKKLDPTFERLLKDFEGKYTPEQLAEVYGLGQAIEESKVRARSQEPLNLSDVLRFHETIATQADILVPEKHYLPGKLRDRARSISGAVVLPPFPKDLEFYAQELFGWLSTRYEDRSVVSVYRTAARLHHFMGVEHFTVDFNGRTSRLTTDTFLRQMGFRRVSDWEGELIRRVNGRKAEVEVGYISALRMADRLRYNRWDSRRFRDVQIPNYGTTLDPNQSLKIGEIGEDWLIPVEVHMLRSGLVQERAYLRRLNERGLVGAIPAQRKRVFEMANLYMEKSNKLNKIAEVCPAVLTDCELGQWTALRSDSPHGHPKWKGFVSPAVL